MEGRGLGVFSGEEVRFRLEPAPPGTGILAFPEDSQEGLPLNIFLACEVHHCSAVRRDGYRVLVTEHLLAALHGLGITDLIVRISGVELPMFDGSALPYVELLLQAGLRVYEEAIEPLRVEEPIWLVEEDRVLAALPYPGLRVAYTLEHPHPMIGRDFACFDASTDSFADFLAPARTFITIEEWYRIQQQGILRAGSEENAIVVYPDRLSSPLRLPNELARHKALDILGDLYLLNRPVEGEFLAYRTGHAQNRHMALGLLAQEEKVKAPEAMARVCAK